MKIKPLRFQGNHHQIQVADAMHYRFYVKPNLGSSNYRWGVQCPYTHNWDYCETEKEAKAACNKKWAEILSEFLTPKEEMEDGGEEKSKAEAAAIELKEGLEVYLGKGSLQLYPVSLLSTVTAFHFEWDYENRKFERVFSAFELEQSPPELIRAIAKNISDEWMIAVKEEMEKDEVLEQLRSMSLAVPHLPLDVTNPRVLENASRVHDWRNHVPDAIAEMWNELTERERRLIILVCEQSADPEHTRRHFVWDAGANNAAWKH